MNGADGTNGIDGATGPAGLDGTNGIDGATGAEDNGSAEQTEQMELMVLTEPQV